MNIRELKPAQWRPMVADLEKRLRDNEIRFSRILRTSHCAIAIEGGSLQYTFNLSTGVLHIWGKASRYAGRSFTILELQLIEDTCKEWAEAIKENL